MSLTSVKFLLFLVLTGIVYYVLPKKNAVLLVIGGKYCVLLHGWCAVDISLSVCQYNYSICRNYTDGTDSKQRFK